MLFNIQKDDNDDDAFMIDQCFYIFYFNSLYIFKNIFLKVVYA